MDQVEFIYPVKFLVQTFKDLDPSREKQILDVPESSINPFKKRKIKNFESAFNTLIGYLWRGAVIEAYGDDEGERIISIAKRFTPEPISGSVSKNKHYWTYCGLAGNSMTEDEFYANMAKSLFNATGGYPKTMVEDRALMLVEELAGLIKLRDDKIIQELKATEILQFDDSTTGTDIRNMFQLQLNQVP